MAVPRREDELMEEAESDVAEDLIEHFPEENESESNTPPYLRNFVVAAVYGDLDDFRLALDEWHGSIDEKVENGLTALHLSCINGHLACVQLLLERGASIEVKDDYGAIPLHHACDGGFTTVAQILIDRAGNPEAVRRLLDTTNVYGDTPLHEAAKEEHVDTIRLLLAHGALPSKKNNDDKTPAELADPGTEARRVLEAAASPSSAQASTSDRVSDS